MLVSSFLLRAATTAAASASSSRAIESRVVSSLRLRKTLCDLPSSNFTTVFRAFHGAADAGGIVQLSPVTIDAVLEYSTIQEGKRRGKQQQQQQQQQRSGYLIRGCNSEEIACAIERAMKAEGFESSLNPPGSSLLVVPESKGAAKRKAKASDPEQGLVSDFLIAELGVVYPLTSFFLNGTSKARDDEDDYHLKGRLARSSFLEMVASALASSPSSSSSSSSSILTINLRHRFPGTLSHLAASAVQDAAAGENENQQPSVVAVVAIEPREKLREQSREVAKCNDNDSSIVFVSPSGISSSTALSDSHFAEFSLSPHNGDSNRSGSSKHQNLLFAGIELDVAPDGLVDASIIFAVRKAVELLARSSKQVDSAGKEEKQKRNLFLLAYGKGGDEYLTAVLQVAMDFSVLPSLSAGIAGAPESGGHDIRISRSVGVGSEFPLLRVEEGLRCGACAVVLEIE